MKVRATVFITVRLTRPQVLFDIQNGGADLSARMSLQNTREPGAWMAVFSGCKARKDAFSFVESD